MNDWKKELETEYTDLFRYCRGGISVGDGWRHIIKGLCVMMTEDSHVVRSSADEEISDTVSFTQIKEKFGTLRIYTLNASEAQHSFVSFAEEMSRHVCEECGKPGKIRSGGWIRTLCDEHASQK